MQGPPWGERSLTPSGRSDPSCPPAPPKPLPQRLPGCLLPQGQLDGLCQDLAGGGAALSPGPAKARAPGPVPRAAFSRVSALWFPRPTAVSPHTGKPVTQTGSAGPWHPSPNSGDQTLVKSGHHQTASWGQ